MSFPESGLAFLSRGAPTGGLYNTLIRNPPFAMKCSAGFELQPCGISISLRVNDLISWHPRRNGAGAPGASPRGRREQIVAKPKQSHARAQSGEDRRGNKRVLASGRLGVFV